jgi:hypothetical protein
VPRRIALLLTLAALAAPTVAGAQESPFQQLTPSQQDQQTAPTATAVRDTTTDDGGLERWQEILIFGGGVLFILGIGYAIVHDAHRRAPVDDERAFYAHRSSEETGHKKKVDRKKTKAQKAARKRQRARR